MAGAVRQKNFYRLDRSLTLPLTIERFRLEVYPKILLPRTNASK